jgi:hypothetical protein
MTDNEAIQNYNKDQQIADLKNYNKKLCAMNSALIHSLEMRIREMSELVNQLKNQTQEHQQ